MFARIPALLAVMDSKEKKQQGEKLFLPAEQLL